MNTALSLLGISQLEAAKKVEKGKGYVQLSNGELVTIKDLCDFWIEGHKKILETTKIINDAKELIQSERIAEKEKELQAEQKVEGIQAQEECRAEGDRSHNKKETVQGCKSASQKPQRRRVRKS